MFPKEWRTFKVKLVNKNLKLFCVKDVAFHPIQYIIDYNIQNTDFMFIKHP